MKKRFSTLLATFVWTTLYGFNAHADLAEQCLVGVPLYNRPLVNDNINTQPVHIESDNTIANYPKNVVFEGNVNILQGNRRLQADRAAVEQSTNQSGTNSQRSVTATGDVNYDDNLIKLKGTKIWTDLNTKDSDIIDSSYQLVGRLGRGTADTMKLRDNRYQIMENGTFTSCLPSNNSWSLVGSEIIHDRQEEVAEIWNARFKIGPVPVFYSPYLQLPTGNKRRSGFLIPSGSYSNNSGIQFLLPFYWNIAPSFDATITPHYMGDRGMQLQNEFRYLLGIGAGLMQFDWINHDRRFKKNHSGDDDNTRWLFHWQHGGTLNQVWRFNVDYTKVSDRNYLSDLDTPYGDSTDGYVNQKYSIGYADKNWDTSIQVKQFQVFGSDFGNKNAYRAEPQLNITNYLYDLGPFNLQTFGQVARFSSENHNNPKATRFHIEPALSLPITNSWGSLNTEVKLMGTHYQQSIPSSYNNKLPLEKSINRFMPQYKVNAKVIFDREMINLDQYTQTLEPKVQYLYRPYKNQDHINSYDSTLLQSDYTGLFRDRTYSGLDRIVSANQLTTGITSRVYDENLDERFNLSIGQIYYFKEARMSPKDKKSGHSGSVVWAGDTYWKMNDRFGTRAGLQYDNRADSIALGEVVLEYRQDAERMVQLTYRYASEQYISAMVTNPSAAYQQDLNQIGAVASWPLANNWAAVGAYYYDPQQSQMADGLFGIQYTNCCWAANVNVERKIVDWNNQQNRSEYDNKVSFNFELRGLSSDHNLGTRKMLGSNILPYQPSW